MPANVPDIAENRSTTAFARRLPARRTVLKVLHLAMIPLFVWFILVQPRDVARWGAWAVELHSDLGLAFVSLALIWWAIYMRRGLAGRPGPKLRGWARRLHPILHKTLIWGVFIVALTGFGLGLSSAVLLWAGGIVPIAPPMDWPRVNAIIGQVHAVQFYALGLVAAGHAGFHVWRHLRLRDNCLRIMAPRRLHRWL
jgi:cytochrome b561